MKVKIESIIKNYVNTNRKKEVTLAETLEQPLSSSPHEKLCHSAMLFPLQSVISDTSISFDNVSLVNYLHENEVTSTHEQR